MEDDLGVGGRVEDGPVVFQFVAQGAVVHEVAVVRDGDRAEAVAGDEGLDVREPGVASGGVADVANGGGSRYLRELRLVEDVRNEANSVDGVEEVFMGGDDAGAFLAAVLEGVEGEGAETGGFWVAVDAHNAALFAGLFVIIIMEGGESVCGFGAWERQRVAGGMREKGLEGVGIVEKKSVVVGGEALCAAEREIRGFGV